MNKFLAILLLTGCSTYSSSDSLSWSRIECTQQECNNCSDCIGRQCTIYNSSKNEYVETWSIAKMRCMQDYSIVCNDACKDTSFYCRDEKLGDALQYDIVIATKVMSQCNIQDVNEVYIFNGQFTGQVWNVKKENNRYELNYFIRNW